MKKDGLPVEIFDSKKDYIKRIEYYGLISAEWKLISEINVSENYIEKYFKENKTSRKLIENFLIKIIDNINLQNSDETEDTLVDTLIELKDNLMLFRKQNDNKKEYQQAKEMYENLQKENAKFIDEFNRIDKINKKANSQLISTMGSAFASGEQIYYGDIEGDRITDISKELLDMFALIQQTENQDKQIVNELKTELVKYITKGGKLEIPEGSLLRDDGTPRTDISIEEMYELTAGKVEYGQASSIVKNMYYLSKGQANARILAGMLR